MIPILPVFTPSPSPFSSHLIMYLYIAITSHSFPSHLSHLTSIGTPHLMLLGIPTLTHLPRPHPILACYLEQCLGVYVWLMMMMMMITTTTTTATIIIITTTTTTTS